MTQESLPRSSTVGGSRKAILANMNATASSHADDQESLPLSNTDTLLRNRRGSETNGNGGTGSVFGRKSRSNSIASRTSRPDGDAYLAPPETAIRSRTLSVSSLRLKKNGSNSARTSEDNQSVESRRPSLARSFSNLLRTRSRNASQTNLSPSDASPSNGGTPVTSSRLRTYSSVSRKTNGNNDTRATSASIKGSLYDEPEQMDETPQVLSLAPTYPITKKSVDGYKSVSPTSPATDSPMGSGRTRKFTKSNSQPDGLKDPFAKADSTLARARSRSKSGNAQSPPPAATDGDETIVDRGEPADQSTEKSKSFFSSTAGKATGAVAGAAGAAGTMFGRARRASSRSASQEPDSSPAPANTNGNGKSKGPTAQDSDSSDSSDQESEEDAPAAGITSALHKDQQSSEEEEESDDEEPSSSDDDDDFHDALLADITEGEEDDDDSDDSDESEESEEDHHNGARAGAAGAAAGAVGAAGAAAQHRRQKSREAANGRGTRPVKSSGGSAPLAETVNDAKAKGDVSQAVRDKAARVAKLTAADVQISSSDLRADIEVARGALNLFLNSRMIEAERIIEEHADRRLYYALGYALIATIKGFMTFEPADLAVAISLCKDSLTIANLLRKPTNAVSNFGRFVRGTGQSPSAMAQMDEVQRHAELVYAESVLLKAVLGIVYAGDFFAFVSEALNMRNAYGIYRSLSKFVEHVDQKGGSSIDQDFRSGVYLGNGLISMILGLLPGKVLKIMEVFGYTGDCEWALKTLSKAGDWSPDAKQTKPGITIKQEGVRRQICDMALLMYHLVISTFIPVNGVDINFADKVLHYNLKRYPEGVFFLYFSGRLYSTQALAEKAITQFETARDVQKEYVQLKHICVWDLALCNMSLSHWKEAHDQFAILAEENNWSKAVYSYGRGATLYESAAGEDQKALREAGAIFHKVPSLTQKIAGKSIPMEKFVARKSKKFIKYGRLLLPGLEFSYVYHCLSNAPRYILCDEALVLVSDALADLHDVEDPSQYHSGEEYYDDLCLAHFLRGVCLKFIACPEPHTKVRPKESPIPEGEAAEQAEISFKTVLEHGHKLQLDHWIVYFAHYELGRLYAGRGRVAEAKEQLNLVLSQKTLEDRGRKGKYSLQNMVHLRANGALNAFSGTK